MPGFGCGAGTQVLRNTMEGIDGNTISDVYDCGIETLGISSDSVFSNNTIHHAGKRADTEPGLWFG